MRYRVLGGAEHRLEADVHRPIPILLRQLDGVAVHATRVGIVDDDVQPTPEIDGTLDHAADPVRGADVDEQRLSRSTRLADRLHVADGRLFLYVGNEHVSAIFGEASGGCSTDTHCAAGNDGYLTCESWQRWYPRLLVCNGL